MDTLTHALSGALAARATAPDDAPPRSLPRRIAAGFFACAFPDADIVVGWIGPVEYLVNHRGVTHSILLIPFWAFILAWLLAKILREPRGWRALYGVSAIGLALHILGDLITSFGTIILAPFSDWRAGIGTTFIIDLWLSGIILAGLAASAVFYRSRAPAIAAFAVICLYIAFQYTLKNEALEFGTEYARSKGLSATSVAAHPRPVSPFNWTVYVSDDTTHRFAYVNLRRKEPPVPYKPGDGFVARLDSIYMPLSQAIWVERTRYGHPPFDAIGREAWNTPGLAFFRWFAALPALDGYTDKPQCAWFIDLRFVNPGRDWVPFQFGTCRETPTAPWKTYERAPNGGRTPVD
jgi:inner membrane protein